MDLTEEVSSERPLEHTPKHPQFLVYGSWLYGPSFLIAIGGFGSDTLELYSRFSHRLSHTSIRYSKSE